MDSNTRTAFYNAANEVISQGYRCQFVEAPRFHYLIGDDDYRTVIGVVLIPKASELIKRFKQLKRLRNKQTLTS